MSRQQPICLSSDESSEDEDSPAQGSLSSSVNTTVIDLLAPNLLDQTPPQQQKRKLCAQAAAGRKVATLKRMRLTKGVANDNEGDTTRKWREQRQAQREQQEQQERQDELFA